MAGVKRRNGLELINSQIETAQDHTLGSGTVKNCEIFINEQIRIDGCCEVCYSYRNEIKVFGFRYSVVIRSV